MSFADLEARANSGVMARLSNAVGVLAGGAEITLIFDRVHIEAMGGQIDAEQPMCLARTSDITANDISFLSLLTIGGTPYQVKGLHPDGTGLTTLMLEEA